MKLTDKQNMFVAEYLIDLNATQAAIRAGYSEKTAAEQAARLLGNVNVQKALQQRMKDREARTAITADRVLKELAKPAFSEGKDIPGWEGLRPSDRLKALELIGKHMSMFVERIDHSGSIARPYDGMTKEQVLAALEKAEHGKL